MFGLLTFNKWQETSHNQQCLRGLGDAGVNLLRGMQDYWADEALAVQLLDGSASQASIDAQTI